MNGPLDIRYRDFWDVPRIFLVEHEGNLVLFDCPFDEDAEDYPEIYQVYLLPPLKEEVLNGSWAHLAREATRRLGEVPLSAIQFDLTRRRQIDSGVLRPLLARLGTVARS